MHNVFYPLIYFTHVLCLLITYIRKTPRITLAPHHPLPSASPPSPLALFLSNARLITILSIDIFSPLTFSMAANYIFIIYTLRVSPPHPPSSLTLHTPCTLQHSRIRLPLNPIHPSFPAHPISSITHSSNPPSFSLDTPPVLLSRAFNPPPFLHLSHTNCILPPKIYSASPSPSLPTHPPSRPTTPL